MVIRYDDMRVDRLLIEGYKKQLEVDLKRINGLNDIDILLAEFEKIFAAYIGTNYAVALNSGTDALLLSLLILNVGKGDSVIIPNITYPAVPLSVIYAGAKPILVDIKEEDLEIDENLIEKNITKNTKAIIAVHMFSRPCNIDKIIEVAKKNKLFVIEDCCQAESSEYSGKKLGSFGDLSCFSFSYYKPLSSCGGGGGMVCFNKERYKKILNYTQVWKDDDNLLKIGRRFARMYLLDLIAIKVKFKYIREIIKSRMQLKKIYNSEMPNLGAIKVLEENNAVKTVLQNYTIFTNLRDQLYPYLKSSGIVAQYPYTPINMMNIFKKFAIDKKFPASKRYFDTALHLPLFSFMKQEDCFKVISCVRDFFMQHK